MDDSASKIIIEFDWKREDKSFEDYDIVINEVSERTIKAERDNRDIFKAYPITKNGIVYIKSIAADSSVTAAKGTSYSLNILSIILVLVSVSMAVIMIKLFQLLFFLLFINVNLPSNAARFINSFRKNIMDYFPTFIRLGGNKKRSDTTATLRRIIQETTTDTAKNSDDLFSKFCTPHKKLEENDQTCSVFINLGSFITQLMIFLTLKLLVYSIRKCIIGKSQNETGLGVENRLARENGEGRKIEGSTGLAKTISTKQQNEIKIEENNGPISKLIGEESTNDPNLKRIEKGESFKPNAQKNRVNQLNIFNRNGSQNNSSKDDFLKRKMNRDKKTSCLIKVLDKIDSFLNMAYFFNIFKAMQLKAVIGAMTSILSIDPWSISGMLNILFSVIVVVFYILLVVLVGYLITLKVDSDTMSKTRQTKHPILSRQLFMNMEILKELKEESKDRKSMRRILALSIIQDLFIPLGLTIFVDAPGAQIVTSIIFIVICLFTVITHTPFQQVQTNFLEAGNRAIYILILLVFLINLIVDKKISEKNRFNYLGFGIIGLVSLLIGFNIGIAVWVVVDQIKKMFKKKDKNKINWKNQLHPIERKVQRKSILEDSKGFGSPAKDKGSNGFEFLNNNKIDDQWNVSKDLNQQEGIKDSTENQLRVGSGKQLEQGKLENSGVDRAAESPFLSKISKKSRIISFDNQKSKPSDVRKKNQVRVNSTKLKSKNVQGQGQGQQNQIGAQKELDEFMFE